MTDPAGQRIEDRIAARHDDLTPGEARAAATLLEHLEDLGTYRATELAELAGVSKATMSRLFRSLGFSDFDEVRNQLRGVRADGEPRGIAGPSDRDAHLAAEYSALRSALAQPAIGAAITTIGKARRVVVIGWRNSYPVAMHLRQQLSQVRDSVALAPLPGQTLGEELTGLGRTDTVVLVGIRRRPAGFTALLSEVANSAASVVLLTDPGGGRYRASADVWIECPVEGVLAFDSYAAAMSIVAAIADGVLRSFPRPGRARVSAISDTYGRLRELER